MDLADWFIQFFLDLEVFKKNEDGRLVPDIEKVNKIILLVAAIFSGFIVFVGFFVKNTLLYSVAFCFCIGGLLITYFGKRKGFKDGKGKRHWFLKPGNFGPILIILGIAIIVGLILSSFVPECPPSGCNNTLTPTQTTILRLTQSPTIPPTLTSNSDIRINSLKVEPIYQTPSDAPLAKNYWIWDIEPLGPRTVARGQTFTYTVTFISHATCVIHGISKITLDNSGFSIEDIEPKIDPQKGVGPGESITETLTIRAPNNTFEGNLSISVISTYLDDRSCLFHSSYV